MPYEITAENFRAIVNNPKCKGTEIENGKAKDGHQNCSHCKGNYFVDGECNYGGGHKMSNDLKQINKNFKQFDNLVSQQIKLSKSASQKDFESKKRSLLTSFENLKRKCEEEVAPPSNSSSAKIPKPTPLRSELVQKQNQSCSEANKKFPLNFPSQPEASWSSGQSQQLQKWNDCYWNHFTSEEKKEIEEYNQKNQEYQQQFKTPLPSTSFFYGSCIGLDGTQDQFTGLIKDTFTTLAKELKFYMEQVQKTTWENLQAFQEKLKKIEQATQEADKLAQDWKNETDPAKKAQLLILLNAKRGEVSQLKKELEEDPAFQIFSQEKNDELANIVKNIFEGKKNFFNWNKKEETETQETKGTGLTLKDYGKGVLVIAGLILFIGIFKYFGSF